jgi:DNA polymerase III epsilon subunit-like protein
MDMMDRMCSAEGSGNAEPAPAPKPAPTPQPAPAPKPAHGKIDRPSVLFFDVETTGLNAKSDRIVQIAWALTDVNGITLEEKSYIIYPSGFTIPYQVARINGITKEIAQRKGVKISGVLDEFEIAARKSKLVVAHNITFDDAFIKEEFSRAGKFHPLFKLDSCCTMRSATELCKLPHKGKRSGYKWPKLQELHMFLFSAPMKNAHDAMADVDACRRCYYELKKRMIM